MNLFKNLIKITKARFFLPKIPKRIFEFSMLLIVLLIINCKQEPLSIKKVELCEFFDSNGICKNILSEKNIYEILLSKNAKVDTWDSLGNYIYFHSKKTPGFIIRFNRKFTLTEKKMIIESYKAYYEFKDFSGKVEGVEFGDDWIGSFQYLGSMIKDRQRSKKDAKSYPFLYTIFPVNLKFSFESELFKGDIETEVDVKLTRSEE